MKILITLSLIILSSCSFFTKEQLVEQGILISSDIDKVEVYNDKNEKIGLTPFKLDKNYLTNLKAINLTLKKEGYFNKEILINYFDNAEIKAGLTQINEEFIKINIDKFYSNQINDIIKKTIFIQENISLKNFESAEKTANDLIMLYPGTSTFYTLLGVIEINKKNFQMAEIHLTKSLNIDPNDELAKNYLNYIKQRKN